MLWYLSLIHIYRLTGKANPYFIAVEPASCPSMARGRYAYDFCDTGKVTPLAKMYTLGCEFQMCIRDSCNSVAIV